MADLLDLAARVEAAEAGEERVVLLDAYRAIFGGPECTPVGHWPRYVSPRWDRFHKILDVEAYESAAMMLAPEGWAWEISHNSRPGGYALVYEETGAERYSSAAATPALALCAAALRARSAHG